MNTEIKTALITGASRGLGRALTLRLAKKGIGLALVARGGEELTKLAAEIRTQHGSAYALVTIAADVGKIEDVYPIAARAQAALGPIDLLVNNASQLGPTPLRLLMDTDCEDFSAVIETNLLGPFRLIKALAGPMLMRERGIVVNISSDAAIEAYPRWGIYGASKAALDHLTRTFAVELAEAGVTFLAVDPGEMRTEMHAAAIPDADPETLTDPAVVAERVVSMVESRRELGARVRWVAADWRRS